MKNYLIAILFIISFSGIKAANSDSTLFLIPQPKKIEFRNNSFHFNRSFSIGNINTEGPYSQQLQNAIVKKFKTGPVAIAKASIKIKLVKATGVELGIILKEEKLNPPFELGTEGYIISVSPESIVVVANENAGVFYGVQTLIQLINANSKDNSIPCLVIYDKPDMQMRGWQDDISRGPIPTMDFLKEEIRRMASFKLNP